MSAAQYGELMSIAARESGKGAVGLTARSGVAEPGGVLGAYTDVVRAVVEHAEFVFGSDLNRRFTEWRPEVHVEVARELWLQELRSMAYAEAPADSSDTDDASAIHWQRAAMCIRSAQDLLSTHFGALDRWRSPDAWAIDEPGGRRAALSHLADIAAVMTLAGPAVLSRCGAHGGRRAVEAIANHHAPARMHSVGLRDLGKGNNAGARTVEQLRAATAFDVTSADPMRRAEEHLRSLRKQMFDLESQEYVGAGVTKDVATVLAGAHGHLSVVLRACVSNSHLEADAISAASVDASTAWARVRTEWNVVDSPTPPDNAITETSVSLLHDLREVTRDRGGWRPAGEISGRRPLATRLSAQNAFVHLAGAASSLEVIVARQVSRDQLLGHAQALPREFVTSDLSAVRARLDGKGVRLPRLMSLHLQEDIEAASGLTRDLAGEVEQQSPRVLPVHDLPAPGRRRGSVARYPTVPAAGRAGAPGQAHQRSR